MSAASLRSFALLLQHIEGLVQQVGVESCASQNAQDRFTKGMKDVLTRTKPTAASRSGNPKTADVPLVTLADHSRENADRGSDLAGPEQAATATAAQRQAEPAADPARVRPSVFHAFQRTL